MHILISNVLVAEEIETIRAALDRARFVDERHHSR